MPFEYMTARIEDATDAVALRQNMQHVLQHGRQVVEKLTRYQQGDTEFQAMINAIYTAEERTELGQMLTALQALITNWETNHPSAVTDLEKPG